MTRGCELNVLFFNDGPFYDGHFKETKSYSFILVLFYRGSVCNVLLTSCEDGVCRLWSETLLPEDSLLGGQISENAQSFSSSLPGLAGNKDKIQHALEVD